MKGTEEWPGEHVEDLQLLFQEEQLGDREQELASRNCSVVCLNC